MSAWTFALVFLWLATAVVSVTSGRPIFPGVASFPVASRQ